MLIEFNKILYESSVCAISLPEYKDMLWIKFLSSVSVCCSANLSCFMIVHTFKEKHKVAGDINSLNLLVKINFFLRICL